MKGKAGPLLEISYSYGCPIALWYDEMNPSYEHETLGHKSKAFLRVEGNEL